jgi:MarR family transcriptional regulator, organic hydroperoxide resistance regulator
MLSRRAGHGTRLPAAGWTPYTWEPTLFDRRSSLMPSSRSSRHRPTTTRRTRAASVGRVLDGIRRLERGLRLAARTVERDTGLSAAQLFVLEHLGEGVPLSLQEIARCTFTDRSSVSVVVDRLVDAGLVSRTTDPEDRRRAQVRISASGRRILERAPTAPTDLLLHALEDLPTSVVASMARSFARLNEQLGFTDADMLFESR